MKASHQRSWFATRSEVAAFIAINRQILADQVCKAAGIADYGVPQHDPCRLPATSLVDSKRGLYDAASQWSALVEGIHADSTCAAHRSGL